MNTVSLADCQALKEAGFPQEGHNLWEKKEDGWIINRHQTIRVESEDFIAIPELEPFLDWFPSFAERWAEKMEVPVSHGPILSYIQPGSNIFQSQYWGQWSFNVVLYRSHDLESYKQSSATNPSPLTAVLELVKQMIKEME